MKKLLIISLFLLAPTFASAATLGGAGITQPINNLGLIGYWPMEDGTGATTTDWSGFGRHGKLAGTTKPTWTKGKIANALSFDGATSRVDVPTISVATTISVSAWVFSSNFNQKGMVVMKQPVNQQWELYFENTGGFTNGLKWRGAAADEGCASGSFPTNSQWHHIAVTQSGTTCNMYIDGVLVKTATITAIGNGTTPGTNDLLISTYDGPINSYPFNGKIDDVRIYNRALSAAEIKALYNNQSSKGGYTLVKPGLTGYWSFNEGTGVATRDESGKRNDGSFVGGGPMWTSGKYGKGLYFDGVDDKIVISNNGILGTGNAPYTLCNWFFATTTTMPATYAGFVGVNAFAGFGTGIVSGIKNGGVAYIDTYSTEWNPYSSFAINKWYHVCVSSDASFQYYYVNGVQVNSRSLSSTSFTAGDVQIGFAKFGSRYFVGLIDDVRIYNRALSDAEIYKIYTNAPPSTKIGSSAATPNQAGLVGYWTMDGSKINWTTNVMQDASGNGNSGQLLNVATSSAGVPGKVGQALRLGGSSNYIATSYTIPAQSSATSFTWSAWLKLGSGSPSNAVILGFRNGATWVKLTPTAFEYSSGTIISNTIPTDRWVQVTVVKNGSNFAYYQNGAVVSTVANSSSAVSSLFYIGFDPGFPSDGSIVGLVDDVRVYNVGMAPEQVKALYNATK